MGNSGARTPLQAHDSTLTFGLLPALKGEALGSNGNFFNVVRLLFLMRINIGDYFTETLIDNAARSGADFNYPVFVTNRCGAQAIIIILVASERALYFFTAEQAVYTNYIDEVRRVLNNYDGTLYFIPFTSYDPVFNECPMDECGVMYMALQLFKSDYSAVKIEPTSSSQP